jgi:hypothetical protein
MWTATAAWTTLTCCKCCSPSAGSSDPDADQNDDGVVDDADLLIVLFNFGSGC